MQFSKWYIGGGILVAAFLVCLIFATAAKKLDRSLTAPLAAPYRLTSASEVSTSSPQTKHATSTAKIPKHMIDMTANGFVPNTMTITVGESIVFRNVDTTEHWPASNIHPTHSIYPEFDPKDSVMPGTSWAFTFNRVGAWRFHDHLWPTNVGVITVTGTSLQQPATSSQQFDDALIMSTFHPTDTWENASMFEATTNVTELYYWLKTKGPQEVMRKLLSESETKDCHQQAHIIGRVAYAIYKANTFTQMETACHSGFMHGAMEAFLQEKGTADIAHNVTDLCNTFTTTFSRFECLHGAGHGIMAYEDYDLPATLSICKSLPNEWDQSSCYGGAFMENVMVSIGGGVKPEHETKWLSSDPQFPCDSVDPDFAVQQSCYLMQTSRMLDLTNQSFEKVATLCRSARADLISTCFQSYGRDAAGRMVRDPKATADICKQWAGDNIHDCIRGALYSIAEFWAERDTTNPHEFCEQFDTNNATYCFQTYGAYIPIFFTSKDPLGAICDKAEEPYQRAACRLGAGV